MTQDIKKRIQQLEKDLVRFGQILKIEDKKGLIEKLQLKMAQPGFWNDQKIAASVVDELKVIKSDVDDWQDLYSAFKNVAEIESLNDSAFEKDIIKELSKLEVNAEQFKLKILFSGKFDNNNAIVEINSGAGGTEACDWASMIFRMYCRWAEDKGFKLKVLDELRGDEAGLKSVTFFIQGIRAYGLLRSERGVHRLVRISPFDSNKRRHTSFASVDVLPEIKDDVEIEIRPEELKIDTYRASGAGGQHVNVTDSAVRITHMPSGIVVACQNERSQHQNKQAAFGVLKAKLYERKEEENRKELEEVSGIKQRIEWGSQIRSYVLHPYLLVKDHRTNLEVHNAKNVLEGKLDDFIYAYLRFMSEVKKSA
ncbi:MAG: peptide chain release factor 2 [Candidatus Omnitrophica bacterium]|nr:peptide chain release factor 2 [Candidatus Omnitrophota bacterium]